MLARTLANPLAFPTILHSKERITYLPSFREILEDHTILLTCTSLLIAIALQNGTSIAIRVYDVDKILLCLNTVRTVECHLSQESLPTSPPWLATLGRASNKTINRNKTQEQPTQPASTPQLTQIPNWEKSFLCSEQISSFQKSLQMKTTGKVTEQTSNIAENKKDVRGATKTIAQLALEPMSTGWRISLKKKQICSRNLQ